MIMPVVEKRKIKTDSNEVINPNIVFTVRFSVFKSLIAVEDVCCTNPKCDCKELILKFYEVTDETIHSELFDITVDIDTWDIKNKKILRDDLPCENMIQEFIRDFDETSKVRIVKRFETFKKFNGASLKEDLNYDLLQQGVCMNYTEIFNDKEYYKFIFEYKGTNYRVLDQYCTNPKCRCNYVVLVFYEYDPLSLSMDFCFAVRLQFKTGKYEVEEIKDDLGFKELKEVFEQFIQNLNTTNFKILKDRYKRMKKVQMIINDSENSTMKHSNMPGNENRRKKVGRNDPCPCGSGKKYKKCCGK